MNPITQSAAALAQQTLTTVRQSDSNRPSFQQALQLEQTDASAASDIKSAAETSLQTIEKVGRDFESVFLSLMLKEMRNTLDQQNGGLFAGEGSDTFGGMFDLFMGQHMAENNPLGIADAVKTYLNRAAT